MLSLSAYQTTIILPNPQFSDQEGILDTVNRIRAVNGTLFTYIKRRSGRKKLHFDFVITRNKAIELESFIRAYIDSEIRLEDHRGRKWLGHITLNPFQLTGDGRAGPALQSWPVGERYSAAIEFEGVEQ